MKENDINSINDEINNSINISNTISSASIDKIDFFLKEKENSKSLIKLNKEIEIEKENEKENENEFEENNDIDLEEIKLGSKIICPEDNCFLNAIISINPILFEVKSNCGIHERKLDIINYAEKSGKAKQEKECCEVCKKTIKEIIKNKINLNKCYCGKNICESCNEKHLKEEEDLENHVMVDFKFKDYSCCCNKGLKKYSNYCIDCKKNICVLCNKAHKEHKVKKFSELFKLSKEEKKEFKNKIDEQKLKIEKVKNIIDTWLKRTKRILDIYKKKLELYWELNTIMLNKYDISKNYYEEIKNIEYIRDDFDNHFLELLKSENNFTKQNDIILKLLNNENKKQKVNDNLNIENENIKFEIEKLFRNDFKGNIGNICELKKEKFLIINIRKDKKEELYIYKISENNVYDQIYFISQIEGGKIISLTELKSGNLLILQKKYFKIIKISNTKKEINIIQNQKLEIEEFIQITELINGNLASIIFIPNELNNIITIWEKNLISDLYEKKVEKLSNKKPIFIKEINNYSFLVYFPEEISIYSSKTIQEIQKLSRINKAETIKDIILINEDIIFLIYKDGLMIYSLLLKKSSKYYILNYNLNFITNFPNSNNIFLTNYSEGNNFGLIPLMYDSFIQKITLGDVIKSNHSKEITIIKFLSSDELVTVSLDQTLKYWKIKKKKL